MKIKWTLNRPDEQLVQLIRDTLRVTTPTAAVLANRNIRSPEDARFFHKPGLNMLRPPFAMKDMDRAVDRISRAIIKKEKILIFGDYDVDGITGTVITYEFLRNSGALVSYYIPDRIGEGYGIGHHHIADIAIPKKVDLILTVDCGSAGYEAVDAARGAGIDIIITDHHNISNKPPGAYAIINPKQKDCKNGHEDLAGVGVAYYLAICLRKHLRDAGFWREGKEPNLRRYADLVALGTVADMVPLTNDNRILVKTGIDVINSTPRPGLAALMSSCGISPGQLTSEDIAYKVAPRINAAGRVRHASEAVKLLLAQDQHTCRHQAGQLNEFNTERRRIENEILEHILSEHKMDLMNPEKRTFVLAGPGWHEGVLGIVAAKLMNQFYKPIVLLSCKEGLAKGSARSIPGIDIYQALSDCASYLSTFGGHQSAAGLSMPQEAVWSFTDDFESSVAEMSGDSEFEKEITIDYELFFSQISPTLISEVESLQPFGIGNPAPLFMSADVDVLRQKVMGENHYRMLLRQKGSPAHRIPAVLFNLDASKSLPDHFNRIAFFLQWNRWNGNKEMQLIIKEFT